MNDHVLLYATDINKDILWLNKINIGIYRCSICFKLLIKNIWLTIN